MVLPSVHPQRFSYVFVFLYLYCIILQSVCVCVCVCVCSSRGYTTYCALSRLLSLSHMLRVNTIESDSPCLRTRAVLRTPEEHQAQRRTALLLTTPTERSEAEMVRVMLTESEWTHTRAGSCS